MSALVTPQDLDALLLRAGLPQGEQITNPPPPFGTEGLELYQGFIDPRAYLRPALTVSTSLLSHPMY